MRCWFFCSLVNRCRPEAIAHLRDSSPCLCGCSCSNINELQLSSTTRCPRCAPGTHPSTIPFTSTASLLLTNAFTWSSKPRSSSATPPPWSWCSARGSLSTSTTNRLTQIKSEEVSLQQRWIVFIMINMVLIWSLQSFTQSLKRRMSLKNTLYSCGVTYDIVSNIPKVQPISRNAIWFSTTVSDEGCSLHVWKITRLVFLFSPPLPGLGGTRGEGNIGPHGCSWRQRGDSGWRNLHRKIHTGSSGGREHPQPGEATTGML